MFLALGVDHEDSQKGANMMCHFIPALYKKDVQAHQMLVLQLENLRSILFAIVAKFVAQDVAPFGPCETQASRSIRWMAEDAEIQSVMWVTPFAGEDVGSINPRKCRTSRRMGMGSTAATPPACSARWGDS
ncbi:unnamed protein product [Symbiodinium natans]|uniref:Uncharacterized protein n=1 Tax=Symbiodinium natans TaxID=878477 RepID=A0A812N0H9_9DINO|nr:unnamed protein product [Symbiodinium natans]